MATETIRIVISESGSRQTAASIRGVASEATAAEQALGLLKRALAAVGVAAVTREYFQLSSTYQQLQNRIKLVTSSQEQQIAVTRELLAISNATFTSLEDTTELYARLAFNTKNLKFSQQELLTVTTAINQAVILSGAGAREASNALIQLSQGLASGTLRGDELRSVLEQLPFVADVIAKAFDTDRAGLRKLAVEGQVTSEQIVAAFQKAAPEIAAQFAKITPTISQAFTVLKNQILATVGTFNESTGASARLARSIIALANNLPAVIDAFLKLSVAIGTFYAVQALGAAISATQKFATVTRLSVTAAEELSGALRLLGNNLLTVNLLSRGGIAQIGVAFKAIFAAIAANPIGAIALAIGAALAVLILFSDNLLVAGDNVTTLKDLGVAAFQTLSDVVVGAGTTISESLSNIFGSKIQVDLRSFLTNVAALLDVFVGLFTGAIEAVISVFQVLPNSFKGIFTLAINSLITLIEGFINAFVRGLNAIIDKLNVVADALGGTKIDLLPEAAFGRLKGETGTKLEDVGKAAKEGFLRGLGATTGAEDFVKKTFDKAATNASFRTLGAGKNTGPGALAGGVPGAGAAGRSKADLEVESLKRQLNAERELLALGQVKGQLEFNQGQAIIKLNQKLKQDGIELNATQRQEIEGLIKANEEKKLRNQLDKAVADFTRDMQDQLALLNLSTQEREVEADILRVSNAYKEAGIALDQQTLDLLRAQRTELQNKQAQEQVLNSIIGDRARILSELAAAQQLADAGKLDQLQLQRFQLEKAIEQRQGDTTAFAGFENGLDRLALKVTDVASVVEETMSNAFSGAEDALVQFVQTGEFDFGKLVNSILADLTRLLIRMALVAAFNAVTGGAGSAAAAGASAAVAGARAGGGPVSGGRSYLVGEKGPEIFNPPSSGTIVPNNQINSGPTNITVVNVTDPSMVGAALGDPRNQEIIINAIGSGSNRGITRKKLGIT